MNDNTDSRRPEPTAEELQELYEEQIRRMSCPTCGEEPVRG
jgi:hypothetical protein